jgi:hypothetical protein
MQILKINDDSETHCYVNEGDLHWEPVTITFNKPLNTYHQQESDVYTQPRVNHLLKEGQNVSDIKMDVLANLDNEVDHYTGLKMGFND